MSALYPLIFTPWLRAMPWGGTKLVQQYGATPSTQPIGEAWLLSDHSLHQSLVSNGPLQGKPIDELLAQYPQDMLGSPTRSRFPLLLKILDAQQNLSVQVHPDDAKAMKWSNQEGGKTEAWHILAVEQDARIYLGSNPDYTRQQIAQFIRQQQEPTYLVQYEPRPGQTYSVPAGTIHALGNGVLALEVQQTSDATFRLYDWNRKDKDGQPRDLHLEQGLDCIQEFPQAGLTVESKEPDAATLLVNTPYFKLKKWSGVSQLSIVAPAILIPWKGDATCSQGHHIKQGHACFIPASMKQLTVQLENDASLFEVRLP